MSLTERLRKIEARLTVLEQAQGQTVDLVSKIAEAVETDEAADDVPGMTLDGGAAGGARDQRQEL